MVDLIIKQILEVLFQAELTVFKFLCIEVMQLFARKGRQMFDSQINLESFVELMKLAISFRDYPLIS